MVLMHAGMSSRLSSAQECLRRRSKPFLHAAHHYRVCAFALCRPANQVRRCSPNQRRGLLACASTFDEYLCAFALPATAGRVDSRNGVQYSFVTKAPGNSRQPGRLTQWESATFTR